MDDFVTPEPCRLTLSDGQFIDIKKRLNHGETEDMYARMSPDGERLDRRAVRTAKVFAYLMGWSLTKGGTPVSMALELPEQTRLDTIRALDPDRFSEIHAAIETHVQAMAEERAAQKKILSGSPAAAAISPSPSAVVGASAGSAS